VLIINTGDKNTIAIQISYLKVIAILRILPISLYFDLELHPENMILLPLNVAYFKSVYKLLILVLQQVLQEVDIGIM